MVVAYEELIDFIAAGTTPESVAAFQASEQTRNRVEDLIRRKKNEGLTPEETAELNTFLHLEHVMRLAKAKARQRLSHKQA
jgi:uncharacterized protein YnzC (UPF0291/DUF896 family)